MNERIKIIEKSGHKILSVDMSNLTIPEVLSMYPEVNAIAIPQKIRLIMLDVTNTRSSSEIKDKSKEAISELEATVGTVYSALVGIRGIQKIIANAISRNQHFAESTQEAIEWLIDQVNK